MNPTLSSHAREVVILEKVLGHVFASPDLLHQALTHSSQARESEAARRPRQICALGGCVGSGAWSHLSGRRFRNRTFAHPAPRLVAGVGRIYFERQGSESNRLQVSIAGKPAGYEPSTTGLCDGQGIGPRASKDFHHRGAIAGN